MWMYMLWDQEIVWLDDNGGETTAEGVAQNASSTIISGLVGASVPEPFNL